METQGDYNQIIQLILSGHQQAYSELYQMTIQDVYKNVHFLIENKADVDDVVQDIYIQLFNSLSKYDGNRPFKPWLMGIVIKQIQAYRRKRWMKFRIAKKVEEVGQVLVLDFSNEIIAKISNQLVVKLVEELPYKLKQVIILRYLNDYSQEEVARVLEIPVGTVKSRINAALKKLREKVKNRNISEKVRNVYEF
ncbi:sigma-70 family RNA polymerase sigma factor [Schinkia azotoformans]|uniref:RNA polymerase sigma factor n=1 Tax=Schinkia azotoformans LMG 9581 TaxID=1131731 RepID=K6BXW6_SCHAZ|nr:sigma-70 family RNA polymerase sigma factor [Schinkia azotoformans]EKN63770.1 RNA polymerase sigma factor [Schinkia azotoformans LMG 9581]MEC1640978.1 sigma-70 family RNA polymerase sigma factor [Schinkia azotoformans]MEC1944131.1 sigma-70 family RNA polymerase sigma factor [Schinkia azotoformans]